MPKKLGLVTGDTPRKPLERLGDRGGVISAVIWDKVEK